MSKKKRNIRQLAGKIGKKSDCSKVHCGMFLIILLVTVFLTNPRPNLWFELTCNYINYDYYAYDNETFDKMFSVIKKEILNQATPIFELESEFRNHTKKFSMISIAGASGVGKTMLVNVLIDNFPWKENIQHNVHSKFKEIEIREIALSNCGVNLIIIDDLGPDDIILAEKYYKSVLTMSDNVKSRIIFILIYNLSTFKKYQNTNYLDNIVIDNINTNLKENRKFILFRKFTQNDIKDCIEKISKNSNILLNNEEILEIISSIDYNRSGCKKVNAKINFYKFRTKN